MNPLLEVNPAVCLFVMGPQLLGARRNSTRSNTVGGTEKRTPSLSPSSSSTSSRHSPETYRSILEAGIMAASLLLPDGDREEEEIEQIKKTASEDQGMTVAMERLVALVKRNNCYEEWLKNTFRLGEDERRASSCSCPDNENCQPSDHQRCAPNSSKYATELNGASGGLASFHHLLSLQKQGALLACTQYDTVLDSLAGTAPVTLQDTEILRQWSQLPTLQEIPANRDAPTTKQPQSQSRSSHPVGILHLHGVYTNPSNVRLTDYTLCEEEGGGRGNKPHPGSAAGSEKEIATSLSSSVSGMDILREVFRRRLVIFVGFDREYFDPLLPGIVRKLYPDNQPGSLKNPPILLTSMPLTRQLSIARQLPSLFLTLLISEEEVHNLSLVVSSGSPKNFAVGKGLTDKHSSDGLKVQAFLLFNEKQSFRKLGDVIYQQSKSGEIYVRRDALTVIFDDNKILYGNLVTYGGNGLRQLWRLVFSEGSTLLGKGLMALGLQNAAVIWTNRKPAELGNVTGINSVHTYAAHKAVHNMAMAQQHQQSLSSSSSSNSGSVPSPSSVTFTVTVNNNTLTTTTMAQGRTAVTLSSQKPLGMEDSPLSRQSMALNSRLNEAPGKVCGDGGTRDKGERRKEREGDTGARGSDEEETGDRDSGVGNKSLMSTSIGQKIHDRQQPHITSSSSLNVTTQPSSPLKITSKVVLPEASVALSSPPLSTPSVLGLNLATTHHSQAALNAAMSTQLLAGLNLSALSVPGFAATPTANVAGLTSPILFSNNPFLPVLASSPSLSKPVAMTTNGVGGVLHSVTPAALFKNLQSQQIVSGVPQNSQLQFISQLQERIQTHLQTQPCPTAAPSTTGHPGAAMAHIMQRDQVARLLSLSSGKAYHSSSPVAAALSTDFQLEHEEQSKRDRQLEEVATTRTPPIHCIAAPPEVLANSLLHKTGSVPTEHVIEYIDTLDLKRSTVKRELKRDGPSTDNGHVNGSTDEEIEYKSSRKISQERALINVNASESLNKLSSNKGTPPNITGSSKKASRCHDAQAVGTFSNSSSAHLIAPSPQSPSTRTLVKTSTLDSPRRQNDSPVISRDMCAPTSSQSPSTAPPSSSLSSNSAPSRVVAPATPVSGIPGAVPLLYTTPPIVSAAANAIHAGLVTQSLAASSTQALKGYYVVLNPLAGVGGLSGASVQPLVIAAPVGGAMATINTNSLNSNSVQSPLTASVGTAAAIPLQLPGGGLANGGAAGLIPVPSLQAAGGGGAGLIPVPSLQATTATTTLPSPMLYYMPEGSYRAATASTGLAVQALSAGTVGVEREDGGVVGKRSHVHRTNSRSPSSSSSSSLVARSDRAKKRMRGDPMEHDAPGAKWTKLSSGDVTQGDADEVTGLEMKRMDGKNEGMDTSLGVPTKESCVVASEIDGDEDLGGAENILMQTGDDKKCFGSYKGHLQLWEFLLDLLLTPNHGSIIQWTGNEYEFNIVNPEAVVRLWGAHKSKPHMTYEKMCRSLRYYYSQGIVDKVAGKRFTFKFAFDIQKYIIDNKKTSLFTLTS